MKFDAYDQYDPKGLALAVPALLTVWAGIKRFHEELVVVGGLVPHFICRHPTAGSGLPRPGTLDVDIGIALGASAGQYGTLGTDLQSQGFRPSKADPSRFEKKVGVHTIYLDFLVERPPGTQGTAMVDDVTANIMPGIARALATARTETISGTDLLGAAQTFQIPVCDVGPFLALKLRAFADRQAPKDAFDILYTFLHYADGSAAAVTKFCEETRNGNTAFADALACLKTHFGDEDASGPVRAAHFIYGEIDTGEGEDVRLFRQQIRQDMVTLGKTLLSAL